jgi:hypothetical protein
VVEKSKGEQQPQARRERNVWRTKKVVDQHSETETEAETLVVSVEIHVVSTTSSARSILMRWRRTVSLAY